VGTAPIQAISGVPTAILTVTNTDLAGYLGSNYLTAVYNGDATHQGESSNPMVVDYAISPGDAAFIRLPPMPGQADGSLLRYERNAATLLPNAGLVSVVSDTGNDGFGNALVAIYYRSTGQVWEYSDEVTGGFGLAYLTSVGAGYPDVTLSVGLGVVDVLLGAHSPGGGNLFQFSNIQSASGVYPWTFLASNMVQVSAGEDANLDSADASSERASNLTAVLRNDQVPFSYTAAAGWVDPVKGTGLDGHITNISAGPWSALALTTDFQQQTYVYNQTQSQGPNSMGALSFLGAGVSSIKVGTSDTLLPISAISGPPSFALVQNGVAEVYTTVNSADNSYAFKQIGTGVTTVFKPNASLAFYILNNGGQSSLWVCDYPFGSSAPTPYFLMLL
jgi:hypothetical protein